MRVRPSGGRDKGPTRKGARVSQSRIRLRGQTDLVSVELYTYAEGTSQPSESAGLARNIQVVYVEPLALVTDLYRTAVDFLQLALNIDLGLAGSLWLYEHTAASLFASAGEWPSVGDVYRRAAHEFAIVDSFESFLEMVTAGGIVGSNREARDMRLIVKLGRLLSEEPDVVREAEFATDVTSWTFMPSYNVHFFRRIHTIDDFLAIERSLEPRSGTDRSMPAAPGGTAFRETEHASLPTGTVTFLMTDVVESTLLWLQSRALMYQAMRRHDQLLAAAIEANGGVVLKERGEGDSFFAVFQRASDAVVAAVDAQRAIQAEEWPQGVSLAVRVATRSWSQRRPTPSWPTSCARIFGSSPSARGSSKATSGRKRFSSSSIQSFAWNPKSRRTRGRLRSPCSPEQWKGPRPASPALLK